MKFLYSNDLHLRNTQPSKRKDNFYLTQLDKMNQIFNIATNNKCDFILFGGDIFHTYQVGNFEVMFSDLKNIWDKYNIPCFTISGNHCLSIDTEVLTNNGWKFYNDIKKEDKLAQYDLNSKKISYSYPLNYIYKEKQKTIKLKSKNEYIQNITLDHDIIYNNKKQKYIDGLKNNEFCYYSENNNKDYDISDDFLRLLIWTIADATIVIGENTLKKFTDKDKKSKKRRIQFHISKERKIIELKRILNNLNIPFKEKIHEKYGYQTINPHYINIYSKYANIIIELLIYKKEFPIWFRNLSKRQFDIILDTISITDGNKHNNIISLCSINKKDIDVLQEICCLNGYKTKYKEKNASGFKNGKLQYHLKIYLNNVYTSSILSENSIEDVYCFTMPKGTLITRYNGNVVITGNCTPHLDGSLENTSLNILNQCGMIKVFKEDEWSFDGITNFYIRHYYNRNLPLVELNKDYKNHILIVHDYITPKGEITRYEHKDIEDLDLPKLNMVLTSHYHKWLDYINDKGIIFINSGCLSRQNKSEKLPPRVVIIDINEEEIKKEWVMLNCIPYEEVFVLEDIKKGILDNKFIKELKNSFNFDFSTYENIIQELKNKNIDNNIIQYIQTKLGN